MGVAGGISVVLAVVVIVAYRNYKYEQELDSLLWKVDPKDLKVSTLAQQPPFRCGDVVDKIVGFPD